MVLGWETAWELQVLLAMVRLLMLLRVEWTFSIWAPLLVVKPRCPSKQEHLRKSTTNEHQWVTKKQVWWRWRLLILLLLLFLFNRKPGLFFLRQRYSLVFFRIKNFPPRKKNLSMNRNLFFPLLPFFVRKLIPLFGENPIFWPRVLTGQLTDRPLDILLDFQHPA